MDHPRARNRAKLRDMATPDRAARRRAAALAGHEGDGQKARALCLDPDPIVRATAYGSLARLGQLRVADLRAAARDPDPAVRLRATELAVGAEGRSTATDVLLDLLTDADDGVVESAAWAAGERSDLAEALVAAVAVVARGHDDALCREAAVAALGSLGDERGLSAILDALRDKATVRRRAVIALAPFDGPDVDDALRRHTTDRDRQVRQAAEDLLGR